MLRTRSLIVLQSPLHLSDWFAACILSTYAGNIA